MSSLLTMLNIQELRDLQNQRRAQIDKILAEATALTHELEVDMDDLLVPPAAGGLSAPAAAGP